MPHVDIKCFPRELTDEQKTALAADITEVLIRNLNSKESAVSVALTQVEPDPACLQAVGYIKSLALFHFTAGHSKAAFWLCDKARHLM